VLPNPPVNADARDVPAHADDRAARAGYRERYAVRDALMAFVTQWPQLTNGKSSRHSSKAAIDRA